MWAKLHLLAAAPVLCLCLLSFGCAMTGEGAAGMLGKLTGKKTPEEVLNIKTPTDRAEEIIELGETADSKSPAEKDRVVAELSQEIQHTEDAGMRRHILRALASYRTPLSLAILQAGLKDSDLEVRRTACEAMGRYRGPQAVQDLTHVAAADSDIDVRIAAVRALGETGDQAALAPLSEALIDPDPAIQYRAQEALRHVSGRDYGGNVQAWREYAKTGKTSAEEVSLAERLRPSIF